MDLELIVRNLSGVDVDRSQPGRLVYTLETTQATIVEKEEVVSAKLVAQRLAAK
jgi:hypothetical protein